VFVALVIQHAMRMRCFTVDLGPVWLYSIFPDYLINGAIFEKKNLLNTIYVFLLSLQFCLKHFLF
jgi:hypothetical protein